MNGGDLGPGRTELSSSLLRAVMQRRVERRPNPSPHKPNRFVWLVDGERVPGSTSSVLTRLCQTLAGGPYVTVPGGTTGRAVLTERGRLLWSRWSR